MLAVFSLIFFLFQVHVSPTVLQKKSDSDTDTDFVEMTILAFLFQPFCTEQAKRRCDTDKFLVNNNAS